MGIVPIYTHLTDIKYLGSAIFGSVFVNYFELISK